MSEDGLMAYKVQVKERCDGTISDYVTVFLCAAEDVSHAQEQALDAYPGSIVYSVCPVTEYTDQTPAGLREAGHAVVIFSPEELVSAPAGAIEDAMVNAGWEAITFWRGRQDSTDHS